MNKEDMKAILNTHKYDVLSDERMKNGYGDVSTA